MIFSTAAFAAPVQIDTVTTAAEHQAQIISAESNLPDAQIAEEENYGTLIYNITFDGTETALDSTGRDISGYGYVNTEAGFPRATLKSTFDTTEIKGGAAHVKASLSYPRLVIDVTGSFPEGKYFVSTDFTNNCTDGERDMTYAYGDSWLGGLGVPVDGTKTITGVITYMDGKLTYNGKRTLDISQFGQLDFYTSIGSKGDSSFVYDNIKLYYKAPVTVTFADSTGYASSVPAVVKMQNGDTLDLAAITCTSDNVAKCFDGWSYTDGGEVIAGNPVIDENKTLYAVWSDKITPKSYSESSIRVTDPSGIRFKASVKNETKADEKTTEYGFIVTTEAHLGTYSADYLTFEQKDVFCISGFNYGIDSTTGKNVDRIYATDEINTYFTVVLYGIPAKKENYEQNIVVRPYIKYDGTNCYGEPIVRSVLDVAEAIRDGGYTGLDASGKKAVQDILTLCEKAL